MTDREYDPLQYEASKDPDEGKVKNLWQKLDEVMLNVGYIQKRGQHKNFRYVQNIDIRKEIREELATRNIFLKSACTSSTQSIVEKSGRDNHKYTVTQTQLKLEYTFINADNPEEREVCEWHGWSEGQEAFAAYGGMTGGQRHFLESTFLLLTGEIDPEKFHSNMDAELERQQKTAEVQQSKKANNNAKKSEAVMNIVAKEGHYPTPEELEEIDAQIQPLDETWRGIGLKACQVLEDTYPNKRVEDIKLKHLIGAQIFAQKVFSRQPGHISPACNQLADALVNRLDWEVKAGNISETRSEDGKNLIYTPTKETPK